MYFTTPQEVLSIAFSKFCPSITIEAGQSGEREGINILVDKLRFLFLQQTFKLVELDQKYSLFHTIARMKIHMATTLDFQFDKSSLNHFSFQTDIDEKNFSSISAGDVLAYTHKPFGLTVVCNDHVDLFDRFSYYEDQCLKVKQGFIPAMITKNETIIKDDCFGYIMEEYPL